MKLKTTNDLLEELSRLKQEYNRTQKRIMEIQAELSMRGFTTKGKCPVCNDKGGKISSFTNQWVNCPVCRPESPESEV